MVTIKLDHGLCMTCNNAPSCYHHARRGPALFCELFDGYAPPAERPASTKAPLPAESSVALGAADEDGDKYAGLCMDCRHRGTCGHPRPTGGVWHCEDYE